MKRFVTLTAAVLTMVAGSVLPTVYASAGDRPAAATAVAKVKVMPLGDSITGSPGCWRAKLWTLSGS